MLITFQITGANPGRSVDIVRGEGRCCTALAEQRKPPMVVAEVCSTMNYPKRSQYKHAKQKKYHVRNWAEYNDRPPDLADRLVSP